MRLLATLTYGDIPESGPRLHRHAVRGIAWRGRELLFVRSSDGDLKLPGGGVEEGESDEDAVRRELAEEAGASVLDVTGAYGAVVEHSPAREPHIAVFTMTSRYYTCVVADELGTQRLDDYEADLGYAPVWLDVDVAVNRLRTAPDRPVWGARELLVLERLAGER